MQHKIPMMVIGQNIQGGRVVKVVEIGVSQAELMQGEHYPEALHLAFQGGDITGPMVALAPEDALLLTDGLATMKQCLMSTDAVVAIHGKGKPAAKENIAKIA